MYSKGDFHLHTTASDGKLFPKELVNLAQNEGLDIIAITDHDNTFGVEEGIIEGQKIGIKVIPGIELSTRHNGESIHILGYFGDNSYKLSSFQNYLKEIQDYRIVRAEKIVKSLKKFFNIELNFENLIEANHGVIARPHIAKAIIDAGYPYDFRYVFDKFLGSDSPAYVPNKRISIIEGIEVLRSVNAVISLAHPTLIKKSPVEEILKYDFDCIEAIYPLNKEGEEERFKSMAKEYGKIVTAGSDYHGLSAEDHKHGYISSSPLIGNELNIFSKKLQLL
ncbi:PHP domain-containing protein [Clostridium bovifaecis]|uniref:PHP domain-containing protein n=1 Tax=Clostridium bovifaecis TaxID=2184719 RepID=A0A6I6EPN4_9CLOT|nr:PHP domain-containing protein [Clostridium bovifaecis]